MVKKGWETATDGIERPVRILGLPGRHIIDYNLYNRNITNSLFLDKRIIFEYKC